MHYVTLGPLPPNPAELIESSLMAELFDKARQDYDYIVVDTPPVAIVTDPLMLVKYADATIYIVRHRYSVKEMLNIVNNLYTKKEIANMGIVVNDLYIRGYYGYYYGHGYRYGYGYGYGHGYYKSKGYYVETDTPQGPFQKIQKRFNNFIDKYF